ncbi:MAG: glycosyltransferase [Flavobacteriales bacterium]|nr:glycosyltransferase [Flavobacteriales bacterium]
MKVTLITVCFNAADVIAASMDSVFAQTHSDIEVIVIDGASTDGTVDILKRYSKPGKRLQGLPTQEGTLQERDTAGSLSGDPAEVSGAGEEAAGSLSGDPAEVAGAGEEAAGSLAGDPAEVNEVSGTVLSRGIDVLVSEPDKGIYDAMNKGLARATGEVIGFVNAGDLLMTPDTIAHVVAAFQRSHADAVYGDIIMVDEHDIHKVHRTWLSGTYHRENFRKGWMPPHVGTFIKKSVYDRFGHFNTDLRIGADYEILLRFLYKHRIPTVHLREVLVRFRLGGMSNGSVKHILKANREVRASWGLNGLQAPPLLVTRKLWSKVLQFFH